MDAHSQILAPSQVSHSLACNFTNPTTKTLVVVKNTHLQLFDIQNDKLLLINEFPLNGSVAGIESLRANNGLDQLIILTKFAKLSLVSWDQDNYTIVTTSLHFYELELLKNSINAHQTHHDASLRLEPSGYCSLVVYDDLLAFLPFKQEDVDMQVDTEDDEPYTNSIIVPVQKLESSISNIVDCAFLHNYKDATLGILYSKALMWAADLSARKDTMSFILLSLDLSTGASTPILSVDNIPYDIYQVKPLASPLNGVLLIGANEVLHIDNSGNVKGVGVNPFWNQCTDLKLTDQSDLQLELEDCTVEVLPNGSILIIEQTGKFFTLTLKMDGRSVKEIRIEPLELDIKAVNATGITIWDDYLFVANGSSDAVLLKKVMLESQSEVKASTKKDEDDDEDLYDDEDEAMGTNVNVSYEQVDSLINNGPISSFTLGKLTPASTIQGLPNPNAKDVSIVCTTGELSAGSITTIKPTISPLVQSTLKFNNITRVWTLLKKYLVTTDPTNFKSEIFLTNENYRNFQTLDFKNNTVTVAISTLASDTRIVQITTTNLFLFDTNFKKLMQINVDFEILRAEVNDPFVVITSSKGEIKLFELDSRGKKLGKVRLPIGMSDMILTGGSIVQSNILGEQKHVFIVTTVNNQLFLFERDHGEQFSHLNGVNKLHEMLELQDYTDVSGLIPDPFIKEIQLLKLGNADEEWLVILTVGGELIIYKRYLSENGVKFAKMNCNLITGAPENVYSSSTILERRLVPIELQGERLIFVTGAQPYFIMKDSQASPKIFKFTSNAAISVCKLGDEFMYIDNDKNARICSLPRGAEFNYSLDLPLQRYFVGETVNNVVYHEDSELFIISTLKRVPYDAKDEDDVPIVGTQEDKPKSYTYQSSVKLVNSNWVTIDELELPVNEVVNDMRSMRLTVSSRSKKKKEFLVLGIGKYRTEDATVFGEYNIQDIISIVPDPTKPDVNFKFKEISKEHLRGAVTSISEVSGRFAVAQGQKVLIRDLQQDNSTVPVAFYDTATYVSEVKSFGNLLLLGDSLKSLWLLGFDAEPYRLILLGKDLQDVNVSCADFIVANQEIHFLLADDEENLQLLAYDPDDVKSLRGEKLLKKSSFKTNTLTTALRMIPVGDERFQNVGVGIDGSVFKVIPLGEESYRRLYILQQQISDKVAHYCGLNPKSNRYSENEVGFKPILEFGLLKYWFNYLNLDKRLNFSGKVGKGAYLDIWKDIVDIETSLDVLTR